MKEQNPLEFFDDPAKAAAFLKNYMADTKATLLEAVRMSDDNEAAAFLSENIRNAFVELDQYMKEHFCRVEEEAELDNLPPEIAKVNDMVDTARDMVRDLATQKFFKGVVHTAAQQLTTEHSQYAPKLIRVCETADAIAVESEVNAANMVAQLFKDMGKGRG